MRKGPRISQGGLMNARAFVSGCLLFLPTLVAAAPFCAVTGVGTNCWYYDVQSCRQAAGPGGACVANPDVVRPSAESRPREQFEVLRNNPAIEPFQRGLQEGAKRRAEEQEWELRQMEIDKKRRDLARQNTDPRLLPLTLTPDGGISPETNSAIMSALFTALDMNAPGTPREWSNPQTGANGAVMPQEIVKNVFGEPCRAFTISLSARGQTRSTSGTACRKDGQWVWQGS